MVKTTTPDAKKILKVEMGGNKGKERPRKKWIDAVEEDLDK